MSSRSFLGDEQCRAFLAKVIVALIPCSFGLIEAALGSPRGSYCRELQFSLFCFLDEVQGRSALTLYKRRVLKMIFDYLINVKSNQAMAAWMAGDLLGDHWNLKEATFVLRKATRLARYKAGRDALAHAASKIGSRIAAEIRKSRGS